MRIILSYMLLIAIGIALFVLIRCTEVHAADQSYCALWARERVRIELMSTEDIDTRLADVDRIQDMAMRSYHHCLLQETEYLKLPQVPATFSAVWAENMRALIIDRAGTTIATTPLTTDGQPLTSGSPRGGTGAGSPAWRAACEKEYRTWDPETGTVIRRGSPKRVPCPCGEEVNCG